LLKQKSLWRKWSLPDNIHSDIISSETKRVTLSKYNKVIIRQAIQLKLWKHNFFTGQVKVRRSLLRRRLQIFIMLVSSFATAKMDNNQRQALSPSPLEAIEMEMIRTFPHLQTGLSMKMVQVNSQTKRDNNVFIFINSNIPTVKKVPKFWQ